MGHILSFRTMNSDNEFTSGITKEKIQNLKMMSY